jgi:hypothetical protein
MAPAPIGVPDLSIITTTLMNRLQNYLNANGANFVSLAGLMPDVLRKDASACNLSLALFHVTEDKFRRNTALGQRAQMLPFQPMSLNLYYLLTAYCEKDFVQEQQAMSFGLQFFYQNPIVKMDVDIPGIQAPVPEEVVITMEVQTSDELSRFWQGITVPMRTSAIYKVGVVLLTPPAPPALAPQVKVRRVVANPTVFPFAASGQVVGTSRVYSLTGPDGNSDDVEYSPAVVAPGDRLMVNGVGLNQANLSDRVFLLLPNLSEMEVTQWKTHFGQPHAYKFQADGVITLDLPDNAPAAGVYLVRAGSANAAVRTNSAPFSISARIDVSATTPILTASGGNYTLAGEGFLAGHTEILLDGIALSENTGSAQDGQFTVTSPQAITFRAPTNIPSATYTVRVRVNGVESLPAWWIKT